LGGFDFVDVWSLFYYALHGTLTTNHSGAVKIPIKILIHRRDAAAALPLGCPHSAANGPACTSQASLNISLIGTLGFSLNCAEAKGGRTNRMGASQTMK
jgi:hypothetical protein